MEDFNVYKSALRRSWPLWIGLSALFVPTIVMLASTVWSTEEQAHGPIIIGVVIYLFWQRRGAWLAVEKSGSNLLSGLILSVGLVIYVIGRSQGILLFEVGALIWILVSVIMMVGGMALLRQLWFPLFFMCFALPMPSVLVDTVTMPMKMAVSYVVEQLLFSLGYPIARAGVALTIGQFVLLVANACAGLQTLFTLEAMGLLYLNVFRSASVLRNATLAVLIVPISFAANVIRVTVLTLITYYYGDAAGQGFLHGFAGMVLFLSALALIVSLDTLLRAIDTRRGSNRSALEQLA